jgi:7-carboxy-7-deazaguanine synthase
MEIIEVYHSILGESSYAGLPSIFVRLAGCNLNCAYCDTPYAKQAGYELELAELCAQVGKYGCERVVVTGGEPLLQAEVSPFCRWLLENGYQVLLETNGSLDITRLPPGVVKIMDIKCPGSGEHGRMRWENLTCLAPEDEIKFVICDRSDYEWAKGVIQRHELKHNLLMGVAYGCLEPKVLVDWILEDNLPVRFQLQFHKYIWPPDSRGV